LTNSLPEAKSIEAASANEGLARILGKKVPAVDFEVKNIALE
jgi:hypothetical protein